jgi:DNA-binding NarL/FixJ family response regulator
MKVLLIDDHALFREGMALLLRPLVESLEIYEAGNCQEAFALLEMQGPVDLVMIDIVMPGISGIEGLRTLRARYPQTPLVALSSSDDKITVMDALDAGAMGFIPKSSNSSILISALRLIMAKGIYLPPSVFLGGATSPPLQACAPVRPAPGAVAGCLPSQLGLTHRQADVLYQILQGKSVKLIGRDMGLSPSTVKAHTSAVLRALNVTTRTQAVVAAGRIGLHFDEALRTDASPT